MDIPALLVQFVGSLIAIFALFALARWLKLGGKPTLETEADARRAAGEVMDGYEAQRVSIARGGAAVLTRDAAGQILVIKRHGNQFAGRLLDGKASVREEVDALVVDPGEARFGTVRLALDDPGYWADAINRL
ncbi:hypothetical protein CD351_01275 [Erythrobacter sp. KY5]|uniref:hypothetical protein n=1 Tax=Erythrobacter sp. KY5 TaxID=2011159 RepID=UPI000DBF2949|nr:hypothetical protein [Erythrobacter sp. KY5]AWW73052.1 hypothetical protein CD351_01275 [Erythrobacter sp. KY5]